MSRGFPSMTALLGLLAIAGYQNRDKIAEMLGGIGQRTSGAAGQGGIGGLLGQLSSTLGGASAGGILSGGLGELVDRFKQSGQSETAESWVKTGPNKQCTPAQLEQAIGPEVLDTLSKQTGLAREDSCFRDCAANSLTQSINTRRKGGSRRKRNFHVRETPNGATLAETSVARSGTDST
jgi:uncharacterized protein YidB (DUF937 family)